MLTRILQKLSSPVGLWLYFLAIVILTHGALVDYGYFIHDSDAFLPLLWVEELRTLGNWTPHLFQTGYAGTLFAEFRFLWVSFLLAVTSTSIDQAHFAVSYIVFPFLLSLLTYWSAMGWFSRSTSVALGTLVAFGFPSWLYLAGFDHYFSILFFGVLYLGARGRIDCPWTAPASIQLAMAILTGTSVYVLRANALLALIFWIPAGFWRSVWVAYLGSHRMIKWSLASLGVVLILIHLLLMFQGPNLGVLFGTSLRLHPESHFKLTVLFWIGFLLYFGRTLIIERIRIQALLRVILGFLIGFSPEWLNWVILGASPGAALILSGPDEIRTIVQKIPTVLREVVWGEDHLNFVQDGWELILAWGWAILFLLAWSGTFQKGRNRATLVLSLFLSLGAFFQIVFTGAGETRYLFPIYAGLIFGIGRFVDHRKGVLNIVFAVLIGSAGAYSFLYQRALVRQAMSVKHELRIQKIVELAREEQVPVVLTDSYWHANAYGFYSRNQPYFTSDGAEWGPLPARKLLLTSQRILLYFTGQKDPGLNKTYSALDLTWAVRPLIRTRDYSVYFGERLP